MCRAEAKTGKGGKKGQAQLSFSLPTDLIADLIGPSPYLNGISEIEIAVANLSRQDLSAFRDWFQEFDADAWDRQLEADVSVGRLDMLAEEALRDLREGRCTDL
jgi:hypothetical protein